MSNYLAIATVTAALRQSLQEAVAADVPGATVTIRRPEASQPNPAPVVNLYLFQVTPNAAWRNADLPTRDVRGRTVQRPRVALDLHYLLSFYGDESTLEPERLLGSVVRRLHEWPMLARGRIETTVADPAFAFLAASNLAEESEQVKFAPSALSLEELSKLWSVFFQMPYVLSVAYQGTVVLIDGEVVPRPALPVRERRLEVAPFSRPVVEGVATEDGPGAPVLASSRLVIRGRNLRGEETQVRLAGQEIEPIEIRDTQVVADLSALDPGVLRAGVLPLQVVHRRLLGSPPTPHPGTESNVAAVVLRPTLLAVNIEKTPARKPPISPPVATVEAQPPVGAKQRAVLLLRGTAGEGGEGYTLSTPPRTEDSAVIDFSVAGVEPGEYLASVQVDGAESPLEADDDPQSPTFERYIGPKVTVP